MKREYGLIAILLVMLSPAAAAPITSYGIDNRSDAVARDVPVTFGAVFAPGDVPAGSSLAATDSSGKPVPLQVDAKARNKDGSLRHAVLTAVFPSLPSGRQAKLEVAKGSPAPGSAITLAALPSGFDAVINLTEGTDKHTISLRDLMAHGKPDTWLSGPLAAEWWFSGAFRDASGQPDPLLSARFGIRSYGPGRPLRVEIVIENTWTWVAKPVTRQYGVEVVLGGKQVFAKERVIQQSQTRWRQVFWAGPQVDVYVRHDLAYLKASRAIPNFDSSSKTDVGMLYRMYQAQYRGPMGSGIIGPHMPVTGQRPDIGPLPMWTVAYLLTMDPRAAEVTMNAGDLAGSFPSHYRNERTGRPASSEEFPKITVHYNFVGRPGNLARTDYAGLWKGLTPEASHEPSLAFVPYLVTGEKYYLEELQFWSQWNAWGTAPEYHGLGKGLIVWDQIRGQAWSLRTLAQAAYITPDADPMKGILQRQMKANAQWYDTTYTHNPNANALHFAMRASQNIESVAPWMDDYLTWATQYAVQLGFDEFKAFARWKAEFPVQRMINPNYCYVMATKYYMRVLKSPQRFFDSWAEAYAGNLPKPYRDTGVECASDDMAKAFKLSRAGEMAGNAYSPDGYPAQMQPALAAAVDAGVPGAEEAWTKYRNRSAQPRGGIEPRWNIIPWRN